MTTLGGADHRAGGGRREHAADLLLIGGGLANSFVFVHLVERLRGMGRSGGRPLRVVMIDRRGDFGAGVPYGRLADTFVLLNENGATMATCGFADWLIERRGDWEGELRDGDDPGARRWLSFNARQLESGLEDPQAYEPLYLPRSLYGRCTRSALDRAAVLGARAGSAELRRIRAEVDAIERDPAGRVSISLDRGETIAAPLAVLGLGSLPPERRWSCGDHPGYLHDPGARGMAGTVEHVRSRVEPGGSGTRLVLIGSNAAAMEVLFRVGITPGVAETVGEILTLSPSGRLPDSAPSGLPGPVAMAAMAELARGPEVPATPLLRAAVADVGKARAAGYTSLDYSPHLNGAFRDAVRKMPYAARKRFVDRHGMQFTSLNRHTPPEYAAVASELRGAGRLRSLVARVLDVVAGPRRELVVVYEDQRGGEHRIAASAVVDCSGSRPVARADTSLLLSVLAPHGPLRVNDSRRGFQVDDDFEAAPGLFVMGPLLAGCTTSRDNIWNLESAPRLYDLGRRLAATLAARLQEPAREAPHPSPEPFPEDRRDPPTR